MRRFIYIIVFFSFSFCLLSAPFSYAQEGEPYYLDGQNLRVVIYPDVNKERVFRKIASSGGSLFGGLFGSSRQYSDYALVREFEDIYVKAQRILDMYPQVKFDIRIYKNQKQLNENLRRSAAKPNHDMSGELISYYIHAYKIVYTSEQTISRGIIAHEFGHVITENYFTTKIPYQIGELMSQHVEAHIDD
jgi:hypothetical protein